MRSTAAILENDVGNILRYRFALEKDATWNSFNRHKQRYSAIKHLLGKEQVGAEIGVYKGGFGEFLLSHCKLLYLVDPWYRLRTHWGEKTPTNSAGQALLNILQIYINEIDAGKVQIITEFSSNFLRSLKANSLDWIYLDASHTYDATREEISTAALVVKPGGYLIGDDYDPDPNSNQHGVYRAVNEWSETNKKPIILNVSRQWAIRL